MLARGAMSRRDWTDRYSLPACIEQRLRWEPPHSWGDLGQVIVMQGESKTIG